MLRKRESEPTDSSKKESKILKSITEFGVRIEKLEAKDQANSELRTVTSDRIQRLGEEIGEIKEMFKILSDEKKDLEVQINKSNALIEKVNPSKIINVMTQLKKEIVVYQGKFDLLQTKNDKFKAIFDSFKKKLDSYKGEEEVLEIQKEIKKDYRSMKQMFDKTKTHAERMENNFLKINEKVDDASNNVEDAQKLTEELTKLRDDFINSSDKEESSSDSEIHETMDELADLVAETFERLENDMNILKAGNSKVSKKKNSSGSEIVDVSSFSSEIAAMKKFQDNLSDDILKMKSKQFEKSNSKSDVTMKKIASIEKSIKDLSRKVSYDETMQKKYSKITTSKAFDKKFDELDIELASVKKKVEIYNSKLSSLTPDVNKSQEHDIEKLKKWMAFLIKKGGYLE